MRKYRPDELEQFLRELDRQLPVRVEIIIIGGAAIGMRYTREHVTADIDLWETPQRAVRKRFFDAVDRAKKNTGLAIAVGRASIAEPPEDFERRLEPYVLAGATRLKIRVPERHDLALMKVARGETPDLEAIEDIHRRRPLNLKVLVQRYSEMMPTGSPSMFRVKFLAMIERLFGEATSKHVETQLPSG